jgi:choline dehydrogenase
VVGAGASMRFDHIVVGGGAAGSVVAARLSEDPACNVLVLEAGGRDTEPAMSIPFGVFRLQRGPFDWCDTTVPQVQLNQREVAISAGRALGGGGAINFMAWYRGHPLDYDSWAAAGMNGWSWADVLPCFRRSEDHELGASEWHGSGGPIAVTTPRDVYPLSLAFIAGGVEYGLPLNRDFNGREQDGVGLLYSNARDGERNSAARGYLRPAEQRPNLTVRTSVLVQRILLRGGAVRGVAFIDENGQEVTVQARSVVLSAGPLRSPQILMLSGIGPAEHLRDLGVEVVVDLPGVGQNLQDHPTAMAVWPVTRGSTLLDASTPANEKLYTEHRRGPLAAIGQVSAFLRCEDGAPAPDIMLTPMLTDFSDFSGRTGPSFSCLVTLLKPTSRGTLRLRSRDPLASPVLDPRYLETSLDRATLTEGVQRTLDLCESPTLRSFIGPPRLPAGNGSDDVLACIRDSMISMNHPVGTCRSGTDDGAVVDPSLKVRGVDGLRVIDSSVMPDLPRANTHAPSVMIGERGADLLLAGT